jgi:hypothetical protein
MRVTYVLERPVKDDVSELHAEPGPSGGSVTHVHQNVVEDHAGLFQTGLTGLQQKGNYY